ncbi:MAG: acylphosphatase [Chlorobiales bacterium]|nr:acylphosphatase [Chlorobiales bacterium]
MQKRVHVVAEGLVQGVGYRWFVQQAAVSLKLSGFVRNLIDGRVEMEAQGDHPVIEEFLKKIRIGPIGAHVTSVKIKEKDPDDGPQGFEIRR